MGAHQPDQTSGMRSHIRSGIGSDSHAVRNEVDKEVRHEIRQAAIPDEIMAVPAIRHNESDKASAVLVCMHTIHEMHSPYSTPCDHIVCTVHQTLQHAM